jgi:hypothetical protein
MLFADRTRGLGEDMNFYFLFVNGRDGKALKTCHISQYKMGVINKRAKRSITLSKIKQKSFCYSMINYRAIQE